MPPKGQYTHIALEFINEKTIKNKSFNSGCVESIARRRSGVGPFRGPYDSSDSEDGRDPFPFDSEDEMYNW